MQPGTLLLVIHDVIELLTRDGVIALNGTFDGSKLDTIAEDTQFAADIEAILVRHGVTIPPRLDEIIKALPLLGVFIH